MFCAGSCRASWRLAFWLLRSQRFTCPSTLSTRAFSQSSLLEWIRLSKDAETKTFLNKNSEIKEKIFVSIWWTSLIAIMSYVFYKSIQKRPLHLWEYDLRNPTDLLQFLENAETRLVRLAYLREIHGHRLLPRRQEAEKEKLKDGRSALVTFEELQELYREAIKAYHLNEAVEPIVSVDCPAAHSCFKLRNQRRIRIVSVSHVWESREHPDPWGYQLNELIEKLKGYESEETWVFIDYISLYQYKRTATQHESFQHAMRHMHLLYAHDAVQEVVRLENLTPKTYTWYSKMIGAVATPRLVDVYCEKTGQVEAVPLNNLIFNKVPYASRGWCRAELQWASTKFHIEGYAPMTPKMFQQRVLHGQEGLPGSLKFTHRSDSGAVMELQEKIFKLKVPYRKKLQVWHFPADEVQSLLKSKKVLLSLSLFQIEIISDLYSC